MQNDPEMRKENRLFVTFWCIILGLNIYWGLQGYFHGDWTGVAISAAMIGWAWKRIWGIYDESRGITRDDEEGV